MPNPWKENSMSPTDSPVVEITALRKSYGANEVLKGIDLQVQSGEVRALTNMAAKC